MKINTTTVTLGTETVTLEPTFPGIVSITVKGRVADASIDSFEDAYDAAHDAFDRAGVAWSIDQPFKLARLLLLLAGVSS